MEKISFWALPRNSGFGIWSGFELGGTLPSAGLLKAFPKLTLIGSHLVGMTGTLPLGWGALTQLETVYIDDNAITGLLPKERSGMTRLKSLDLS